MNTAAVVIAALWAIFVVAAGRSRSAYVVVGGRARTIVAVVGIGSTILLLATTSEDVTWGLWAVALLVLVWVAEALGVLYPDGVGTSGSIAVMAASYVHYGVHGVLLVPILLGLVAGLSPPLVCRRDWQKVVFNGGAHAVTGACAAGCVSAVVALLGDRSGALLLAAAASVAVHWLVLNGLLGWLFAALEGSRMTRLYWQLLTTDRFLIALGVLGGAGGILWAEGRAEFGLALVALTAMGPRTAAAIQQRTRIARRASGSSFLRRRASRAPEDAETIVGVVMAELWADRAAELLVEARAAGEDTTLGDGDRPS